MKSITPEQFRALGDSYILAADKAAAEAEEMHPGNVEAQLAELRLLLFKSMLALSIAITSVIDNDDEANQLAVDIINDAYARHDYQSPVQVH